MAGPGDMLDKDDILVLYGPNRNIKKFLKDDLPKIKSIPNGHNADGITCFLQGRGIPTNACGSTESTGFHR